ncbi:3-dehydroquinate synthase [Robertkochia solimangrovi]|uniref:3-dehydroquinate synthase n=1 Tax=Robertkochia solimangrovi TaxID=2213046 RepID=UPI00117E80ED|nr:3-dehydroquinate synthase [Robertkochia solimangrovi]TRZ42889.1 3-dehydroquinate synthase [Robertkochia solimangrovi]
MKNFGTITKSFKVSYEYSLLFTDSLFDFSNDLLKDLLLRSEGEFPKKVMFVIDENVYQSHEYLSDEINAYCKKFSDVIRLTQKLVIPGGEQCKNDSKHLNKVLEAIEKNSICRHSFVIAIGGGAILDMVGFAAATAHRGVRFIRIPTTVLSQNDSGVGVKNSFNYLGKKNFLGTFAPPFAVINDWNFLSTLEDRDWRGGISEAVKVALIRDAEFYSFLRKEAHALKNREWEPMKRLIYRCAELHMEHIAEQGDPFESGSSRPLDFGHWAAHKIEQITEFECRHGEAVAIGIALDVTYSHLCGMLEEDVMKDIKQTLLNAGFDISIPEGVRESDLLNGLDEFREHLGGKLTIPLLTGIGERKDVHHIDPELMTVAMKMLKELPQLK